MRIVLVEVSLFSLVNIARPMLRPLGRYLTTTDVLVVLVSVALIPRFVCRAVVRVSVVLPLTLIMAYFVLVVSCVMRDLIAFILMIVIAPLVTF